MMHDAFIIYFRIKKKMKIAVFLAIASVASAQLQQCSNLTITAYTDSGCTKVDSAASDKLQSEVDAAVKDGVKRLLRPAAERETRARLRDDAIRRAVRDFGANVAALILAPPMRPAAPVVGLDPAHRTGCKIAAVSATGAVLAAAVVHPRREDANAAGGGEAGRRFREFCERHGARAVAVGGL